MEGSSPVPQVRSGLQWTRCANRFSPSSETYPTHPSWICFRVAVWWESKPHRADIKLFVANVLRFLPQAKQQYHIVYADPPFPMKNKTALATLVDKHHVLEPGGLFIIHYPAEEQKLWPQQIGSLTWIDERKYGRSLLRFYKETRTDHADIERHL